MRNSSPTNHASPETAYSENRARGDDSASSDRGVRRRRCKRPSSSGAQREVNEEDGAERDPERRERAHVDPDPAPERGGETTADRGLGVVDRGSGTIGRGSGGVDGSVSTFVHDDDDSPSSVDRSYGGGRREER